MIYNVTFSAKDGGKEYKLVMSRKRDNINMKIYEDGKKCYNVGISLVEMEELLKIYKFGVVDSYIDGKLFGKIFNNYTKNEPYAEVAYNMFCSFVVCDIELLYAFEVDFRKKNGSVDTMYDHILNKMGEKPFAEHINKSIHNYSDCLLFMKENEKLKPMYFIDRAKYSINDPKIISLYEEGFLHKLEIDAAEPMYYVPFYRSERISTEKELWGKIKNDLSTKVNEWCKSRNSYEPKQI